MGLFNKKKKELIPEVGGGNSSSGGGGSYSQPPPPSGSAYASSIHSNAPSYRTNQSGYVPPSQGGGGYANHQSHYSRPDPYANQGYPQQQQQPGPGQGGSNGYAGGPAQISKSKSWLTSRTKGGEDPNARNELLAGAPSVPSNSSRGYGDHQQQQQQQSYDDQREPKQYASQAEQDEDEEVEGIKQQMRFVKQESLASTRNAVRIAREAEETARATLDKLGDQSDRIANTERHLDLAKAHNDRAQDETKELEALNRSIFRPNISFNKAAKRDKEEARIVNRHNAERDEREQTRRDQYESRQRIDQTYQGMDRAADDAARARQRARARGGERGRYQFEATASDEEVEDEIDGNLNELSGVVGRLKMLATTAGEEVDAQNKKLSKLGNKVDVLDTNVVRSTQRLARVK